MSEMESKFEYMLTHSPTEFRRGVIETADTMYMGLLWFKERGVPFYAADLLKFAELAMAASRAVERQ